MTGNYTFFFAERNDKSSAKLNAAAVNVIKTMALLSTAFCLLSSPNGIWYILYELNVKGVTLDSTLYHITIISVFCNCCINPFLYSFQYKEFQESAKMLICRRCKSDQNRNTFVSTVSTSVPATWRRSTVIETTLSCLIPGQLLSYLVDMWVKSYVQCSLVNLLES